MKILIALVTAVLGVSAGLYQASKLKAREENLSEIIIMLEEATVYIRYSALPVDELIKKLERFDFIKSVADNRGEESDWRKAWEKAADEIFGFTKDDKNLLVSIGKSLGNSDITGQLAMLELNKNFFTARYSEASQELAKKAKMYRSVGALCGLGMAIMII